MKVCTRGLQTANQIMKAKWNQIRANAWMLTADLRTGTAGAAVCLLLRTVNSVILNSSVVRWAVWAAFFFFFFFFFFTFKISLHSVLTALIKDRGYGWQPRILECPETYQGHCPLPLVSVVCGGKLGGELRVNNKDILRIEVGKETETKLSDLSRLQVIGSKRKLVRKCTTVQFYFSF